MLGAYRHLLAADGCACTPAFGGPSLDGAPAPAAKRSGEVCTLPCAEQYRVPRSAASGDAAAEGSRAALNSSSLSNLSTVARKWYT